VAIQRENGVRGVTVDELMAEDLRIPPYQRPYSWDPATALQLLDDIRDAFRSQAAGDHAVKAGRAGGTSYVLGAVILHRDAENTDLNVVDGQQRLLTLLMIRKILAGSLDGSVAPGEDPAAAVVRVRRALTQRVAQMDDDRVALASFVGASCELIRVETDDPDEAFRVFDSQNYRGKALLPHDLLKAYHLREMRGETPTMQWAIVEAWESVDDSGLDRLFSTYLWRIHRWSRGLPAPAFAARHVDAFKGLTMKGVATPSARYHLAAQAAVPLLAAWTGAQSDEAERAAGRSRFQLDAPVLAGRAFFEMVTFMLTELSRLRKEGFTEEGWDRYSSTDADFRELPSKSRYRYVSELYLAALLYYTNKFGETEVREAMHRLFSWSFSPRTRLQRVQFATINNHASAVGEQPSVFALLRNADSPADVRRLAAVDIGRPQDAGHEKELALLLKGLVS